LSLAGSGLWLPNRRAHTDKFQARNILDMWRLREHVDRLNLFGTKALLDKESKIPGQTVRMAGNIDQGSRLHFSNRPQHLWSAARSRRINNNGTELTGQGQIRGKDFLGVTCDKLAVIHAIHPGIGLGMSNRFSDGLYSQNLLRPTGKMQADTTDPAVKIKSRLSGLQATPVTDQAIDTRSLSVMHL